MKTYTVIFSPIAEISLSNLYEYLLTVAPSETVQNYVDSVITHCEGLTHFPNRGVKRDDLRNGLRLTFFKKKTVVAFFVEEESKTVFIMDLFFGGQDYEALLHDID